MGDAVVEPVVFGLEDAEVFSKLVAREVVMEACGGVHYWAGELKAESSKHWAIA